MAHKKAAGSTRLGRDSQAKRLGVKIYGDQPALAGQVIIRQRGLQYHPGLNVDRGGDDTLYALADGLVHFRTKTAPKFTGKLVDRRYVDVVTGHFEGAAATEKSHSKRAKAEISRSARNDNAEEARATAQTEKAN